jgi:hypothetical protein
MQQRAALLGGKIRAEDGITAAIQVIELLYTLLAPAPTIQ